MAFTQQMSQSVTAVFSKSNSTENIGTAKKLVWKIYSSFIVGLMKLCVKQSVKAE